MSALLAIAAVLASGAASAQAAATRLVIKGRGFGHGVGMSQYGAYGYAQHGKDYAFILGHYYTGTALGKATGTEVGVLLQSAVSRARFTGATKAGTRKLDPAKTYAITRNGVSAGVILRSASGRALAKTDGPLRVTAGDQPVQVLGRSGQVRDGRYRGAIEFRGGVLGGVNVINDVDLEDYVRGVVSGETPSSWPAEALKAQAVAARTYAITTDAGSTSDGFTQYPDTRSQVYLGVKGETAATDAAVAATAGQVVTYQDKPVVTYFFSTSGGETENVENSFIGSPPKPWLKGVDDPYDGVSPKHTWGPYRLTLSQADRKLGSLVRGRLKRIEIVKRGVSPRIVKANIVGTGGTVSADGPTLRQRFGLDDTWATFTVISSSGKTVPATTPNEPADPSVPATPGDPASGGAEFGPPGPGARAADASSGRTLSGRVSPGGAGAWFSVQRRQSGGWKDLRWGQLRSGGRYAIALPGPGTYRVMFRGAPGPDVVVR